MTAGSWVVTSAGWLAILAGTILAVFGIAALVITTGGKSSPAVAAGPIMFGIIIGPIIALVGVMLIISGFKLMSGQVWARMVLQTFSWLTLCSSIFAIVYNLSRLRRIYPEDITQSVFIFLSSAVPALVMIVLLLLSGRGR